jgi:hypothetical protein
MYILSYVPTQYNKIIINSQLKINNLIFLKKITFLSGLFYWNYEIGANKKKKNFKLQYMYDATTWYICTTVYLTTMYICIICIYDI